MTAEYELGLEEMFQLQPFYTARAVLRKPQAYYVDDHAKDGL